MKVSLKNLRLHVACRLIGIAIKIMPKEWQTKTAIRNLILTGEIPTKS